MLATLWRRLESEEPAVVRVVVSDNCSDDAGDASSSPRGARTLCASLQAA